MKTKDLKSLRGKSIEDLEKLAGDKRNEINLTYAKIKAGQEKNTSKVKVLKRDLAQVMTIMRENEIIEESKPKDTKTKEETK
ncbi:50S ribosomal protein L29 [Patescibacteria group bacterium]